MIAQNHLKLAHMLAQFSVGLSLLVTVTYKGSGMSDARQEI